MISGVLGKLVYCPEGKPAPKKRGPPEPVPAPPPDPPEPVPLLPLVAELVVAAADVDTLVVIAAADVDALLVVVVDPPTMVVVLETVMKVDVTTVVGACVTVMGFPLRNGSMTVL